MIDVALTNNKRLFKDVKGTPPISFDSDHKLLIIKLNDQKPKCRKCKQNKRLLTENLKDEGCRITF